MTELKPGPALLALAVEFALPPAAPLPIAPLCAAMPPPSPPRAESSARLNALPAAVDVEELVALPPAPPRLELPKFTEPPAPPLAVPNACVLPLPDPDATVVFVAMPPAPPFAPPDPAPPPPPLAVELAWTVPVVLLLLVVLLAWA